MHEQPELVQTHRRTGHPPGVRRSVLDSVSITKLVRVCTSTDLGPHVLKLARDETSFGVERTRVRSVLVGVDRLDVDAQKRVGDVADGQSGGRDSTFGVPPRATD